MGTMSKVADLFKRVALFDKDLAEELQSEIRRLGVLPPKSSIEELEFLLRSGVISKREVLRRVSPEKSEEEIGALLLEAQMEPPVPVTVTYPGDFTTYTDTPLREALFTVSTEGTGAGEGNYYE